MDDTRGGRHRPFVVFGAFVSAIQYYVKYHRGPLRLTARRAQRLRDYVGKMPCFDAENARKFALSSKKNAQNARKTTEKRPKTIEK